MLPVGGGVGFRESRDTAEVYNTRRILRKICWLTCVRVHIDTRLYTCKNVYA